MAKNKVKKGGEKKASSKPTTVNWLNSPEPHDYPAAASYLTLIASPEEIKNIVGSLAASPVTHQKAKDILRATNLKLLPKNNAHVAKDLKKIQQGKSLSPVLLVRGDIATGRVAQIADGYHRVCASYWVDENTDIPLQIVGLSKN